MPVSVIVGGQFGSEGKGKVAHHFAKIRNASFAIRVGGSNSGHTVIDQKGEARAFRHLPTAAILGDVTCVIGPGSYVDADVLVAEIKSVGITPDRLIIDENAVLITDEHKALEMQSGLIDRIGSTGSGTGAAVIDRISRNPNLWFVADDERLKPFVSPSRPILRNALNCDKRLIVEGTQGFGLSLLHSGLYPKVTSRDTTAAGFIAEAGLSPLDVDEVVMVLRAFPIRVAGDSGALPNEITWQEIAKESGSDKKLCEFTTVTKKVRRVAKFDENIVLDAINSNQPTCVVLNHLDYVDSKISRTHSITERVAKFVSSIEKRIGIGVDFVGFGPSVVVPNFNAPGFRVTA